jgi:hypothetical protein
LLSEGAAIESLETEFTPWVMNDGFYTQNPVKVNNKCGKEGMTEVKNRCA